MRKPSSRIRAEIAELQEALRAAETREAERIGRIALKAGLGEIDVDEGELQTAFALVAERFRDARKTEKGRSNGRDKSGSSSAEPEAIAPGTPSVRGDEA